MSFSSEQVEKSLAVLGYQIVGDGSITEAPCGQRFCGARTACLDKLLQDGEPVRFGSRECLRNMAQLDTVPTVHH